MAEYRVVRRGEGSRRPSLTAASQPITDPVKTFKGTVSRTSDDWQSLCWDMLDAVGELRYYVGWRASSCSRVRLIASDIDENTGLPTGNPTDNERVQAIMRGIANGPLGQAQLLKRAAECLTVPGELWIAIVITDIGEARWLVLTREEIKNKGKDVQLELPDGDTHTFNPDTDSIFRVWNPKPRRAREADSPVRATLDPLNEIVRTTRTIANASKSRLIGNGIVFVPSEMSLPNSQAPSAVPMTPGVIDPDASPDDLAQAALASLAGSADPAVDQLQNLLFQVAQTAYDDQDSLAALVPVFASVPGEQIKNAQHLKFDNSVTEIAIKTRNDAIARLAMGLDVSPERLLGLGQNSNHWTAWQTGDDDVRLHIAPPVETVCDALTREVFRKMLERENIDPNAYVIWYDASALTADPDKTEEATTAFDRGTITAEAYRDFLGLGADTGYDFNTLSGWQAWAQDRVSAKPELLPTLAPLLTGGIETIDIAPPAPAIEATPNDPAVDGAPPPAEDPESEPNTEPAAVTAAVIEVMVPRALELAGKRRRTRSDYARLRDVPVRDTHRFMPPVSPAEATRLTEGWDDSVDDDALTRMGIDPALVRAEVARRVRRELTTPVVDA